MTATEAPHQRVALLRGLSWCSVAVENGGPIVRSPGNVPGGGHDVPSLSASKGPVADRDGPARWQSVRDTSSAPRGFAS